MVSSSARVFLSCGQVRGSEEEIVANQIATRLRQLGFDPYVAVAEQSLRGLTDNIFGRLRESEYFVFVDFKREALDANPIVHRGSLFSHQELAIASFLGLDVLAFQEDGVKRDDGIMRFLQTNAIPFSDRHTLNNVVADCITQRGWDCSWRNELVLARDPSQFSDARRLHDGRLGRYFHVDVINHHRRTMALNCNVYLEKIVDLRKGSSIPVKTAEFKWAGAMFPNVGISPGGRRPFDAFFILHEAPTTLQFNMFSDSSEFLPRVSGEGEFEFTYLVTSAEFSPARGSFRLELKPRLTETKFG